MRPGYEAVRRGTCLRYSIAQGPWQSARNAYSGACRVFTLRARSGRAPVVFEDGLQRHDYVHVGDVARANVLALTDGRTDGEAYNVGGAGALTTLQYADIVREVVGLAAPAEVPGCYRFGDTRHIASDIGKLRVALGWEPTRSVPEIVREYAGWLAETGAVDEASDAALGRMLELGTLRRAGASQQAGSLR